METETMEVPVLIPLPTSDKKLKKLKARLSKFLFDCCNSMEVGGDVLSMEFSESEFTHTDDSGRDVLEERTLTVTFMGSVCEKDHTFGLIQGYVSGFFVL